MEVSNAKNAQKNIYLIDVLIEVLKLFRHIGRKIYEIDTEALFESG